MRLHIVALSWAQTTREYCCDAYATKIRLLCRMLTEAGHHVIHYGVEGSDPVCAENVAVLSEAAFADVHRRYSWHAGFITSDAVPTAGEFREGAIRAIGDRKQAGDVLLLPLGLAQKAISDAHPDLPVIEPGIGYGTTFARFRVFESYAWMHHTIGRECERQANEKLRWAGVSMPSPWDVVIPNYLDMDDYPIGSRDGGYALHIGRSVPQKGLAWAVEACRVAGVKLLVAGQGHREGDGYTLLGALSIEERAQHLGAARCLVAPTLYLEPFGTVAIEAAACGIPAVTTDWGGFTETVEQGVTGWRCRSIEELAEGIGRSVEIDSAACRKRAVERYSIAVVGKMYDRYLGRVQAELEDGP